MAGNKNELYETIESCRDELFELSDQIFDTPETCYQEVRSSAAQIAFLKKHGFTLTEHLADIPTAFSASYGSGRPIIGILGEFDALSGMSQQAGVAEPCPVGGETNGHGCGHNLLGTGSIGAVLALKEWLRKTGRQGTVIYFGTPAEEGGSGKGFLARAGVFDDLDCALSWHPGDQNRVFAASALANILVRIRFHGKAAHAASSPYLGRSALDAVTLMNIGVQFLREHIIPDGRLHYAVTDTGGISPNVVQKDAEGVYMLRAPKIEQCQEIYERLIDVAKGAALMTGTEMECRFIKATCDLVPNRVLWKQLYANMKEAPLPQISEEGMAFAETIHGTIEERIGTLENQMKWLSEEDAEICRRHLGEPYYGFVVPLSPIEQLDLASFDIGDVSHVIPAVHFYGATWAADTALHVWQAAAQGKSETAHKTVLYAAKVLAGTAMDLMEDSSILAAAKAEFQERTGGKPYVCPMPPEVKPTGLTGK